MGHGPAWILFGRLLERANRFFMIEGVDQPQSLVKIPLRRIRRGADRMMKRAEVVIQLRLPVSDEGRGPPQVQEGSDRTHDRSCAPSSIGTHRLPQNLVTLEK